MRSYRRLGARVGTTGPHRTQRAPTDTTGPTGHNGPPNWLEMAQLAQVAG